MPVSSAIDGRWGCRILTQAMPVSGAIDEFGCWYLLRSEFYPVCAADLGCATIVATLTANLIGLVAHVAHPPLLLCTTIVATLTTELIFLPTILTLPPFRLRRDVWFWSWAKPLPS